MAAKKRWKWSRRILKGLIVLVVLLFLLWLFRFPLFGGLIRSEISAALAAEGFDAEVGEISGSLLAGVEIRDIKVRSGPKIEAAAIDRIRASYSVLGLILGSDDWIGDVEVTGLRVKANLDLPLPPAKPEVPEEEPSEPGGVPIPRTLRLDGFDLVVLTGEDRLEVRGASLHTDRSGSDSLTGRFGADRLALQVDGDEHVADRPQGTITFAEGVLSVPGLTVNGRRHEKVLRADLAGLDRDVLALELHFPLFSGRIDIDVDANFTGEFPEGTAAIGIQNLDLLPLLRLAPDLPVVPGRIDGTAHVSTIGNQEPSIGTLSGDYRLDIDRLVIEGRTIRGLTLSGEIADGRLAVRGAVSSPKAALEGTVDLVPDDPTVEASLAFNGLDLRDLELAVEGDPVLGTVHSLVAGIGGRFSAPELSLILQGAKLRFRHYEGEVVSIRARGTPERIMLQELLFARRSAKLTASGEILLGEPLTFVHTVLGVQIPDLADLRDILPEGAPPDLAGQLAFEIASVWGTTGEPNAKVTLDGRNITADGHRVSSIHLEALAPTTDSFEHLRLKVEGGDPLPNLEVLDASVRLIEGAEFPTVTAKQLQIDGHGITVTNEGDISLDGTGAIEAELHIRQTNRDELLSRLPSELPLGFDLEAGRIVLRGAWPETTAAVEIAARDLWVVPPGGERIEASTARLAASLGAGKIELEDISLRASDWSLTGKGQVPFDPDAPPAMDDLPLSADFHLTNVPLQLVGAAAGLPVEAGVIEVHAEISGTPAQPVVAGTLTISDGAIAPPEPGLPRLDGLTVDIGFSATGTDTADLHLHRLDASALGATLLVEDGRLRRVDGLWRDPQLALSLRGLHLRELEGLLGEPPPATGQVEISLTVSPDISAQLNIEGRDLRYGELEPMTLDLAVGWRDGMVRVERGSLGDGVRSLEIESAQVPLTVDLNPFDAALREDAPIALRINSRIPEIGAVIPESPDLRATGAVALVLTAGGTIVDPTATVLATLEKLRVRSPGAPPIDDLSGQVSLSLAQSGTGLRQSIEVRDLNGLLGGGPFGIHGNVEALDGVIGVSDVRVTGENALLVRDEGLRLRSDLDLVLRTNSLDDVLVEGEVKIRSLRYTQDVDFVGSGPSPAPLPLTPDPFLKKLKLKVAVVMPEDSVRIRNNVLEADIVGRLDVGGTVAVPRPKGRVRILNGELILPTTTMKIPRAAVELREEYPLRPFVDAKTTARIAGYDVVANASGPADRMKIDLTSNPTLSRSNIVSLLTTGVVWEKVDARSLGSMAATVFAKQIAGAFGSGDGEQSDLSKFADRFEFDVDEMTATFEIEDWLYLRGSQDDPVNYGLDVLFRLAFK